jgi:pyrroloquinoline quinone (PQQ) biosynthesis protein C
MTSELIHSSRAFLAPRVLHSGTQDKYIVESDAFEHVFEGEAAGLLEGMLPLLTGDYLISDVARIVGSSADSVLAVLAPLNAKETLVLDLDRAAGAQSGAEFVRFFKTECRFWSGEIHSQSFWKAIHSGSANRATVLGWGVEFYHFVESANHYMAAGVANCREGARVREILARHYIEESGHGRIFLEGLTKCGLDPLRVRSAPPLASTQALINYLYELGNSNSFAYAGTFAVMQSSGKQLSETDVNASYDRLASLYPFAEEMFNAFKRHALVDVELDHHKITLDDIVELVPELVLRNSAPMLVAVRALVEHFIQFFEGIQEYYGQPRTYVPRRPLTLANVA